MALLISSMMPPLVGRLRTELSLFRLLPAVAPGVALFWERLGGGNPDPAIVPPFSPRFSPPSFNVSPSSSSSLCGGGGGGGGVQIDCALL